MKKLLIGLVVVVALLAVAVVAIPFLVPTDAVTRRVVALVEAQTGRDLTIGGPVELSLFPSIAVRLGDVRLSNAEGAGTEDMIRLGELDAEIGLLPLLGGRIVIDRFVLRQPVIALEIDENGRANWQFGDQQAASTQPGEPAPAPAPAPEEDGGGGRLTVGEARIIDGEITFVDRRSDRTLSFADVDLTVELGDLSGPVTVDGHATFNGEAVALTASVGDLGVLTAPAGGTTPVSLSLDADPLSLAFEGTASGAEAVGGQGELELSVPSTAELSAWLPVGLPSDLPVTTIDLTGTVDAAADRVALSGMALSLDDIDITGDISASLTDGRPAVVGDLAVTALDLDRFLAPAAKSGADTQAPAPSAGSSPAPAQDSGDTVIDLSPLTLADAQIGLDLAGVTLQGTDIGSSRIVLRLQDGALDLSTSETELLGGTATLEVSAAAADPQTFTVAASLDSVDFAAAPVAVSGLSDLTGTVSGDITGRSRGRTVGEIVANLEGTGALTVADAGLSYTSGQDAEPIVISGLDTAIEATPQKVVFRDLAVTADGVDATGEIAVGLDGPRPAVSGNLKVGRLDLDRYLGGGEVAPDAASDGGGGGQAAPAPAPADQGWSTEPIDFSALHLVDADLDLSAEAVVVKGVETGPTTLAVDLADGVLAATLGETQVFGGTVAGTVGVADQATPRITAKLDLAGVQAEPLLSQLAGFDRLAGTVNGGVDVTASGASQLEIVRTLGGNGAILFSDGAIKGVNIAAMLRNATGAFDAANRGEAQQTDFAELGGTFRIASGVLTSDDIRMLAPLFRIEGAGRSNIPERTLDFRLVPKLVASLEGQGGEADLGGIAVPIIVGGTYDNVTFTPDLAGAIENIIRDPEAVGQQLDALGQQAEQLKDGLGEDPDQAIRGLLQGLTGTGQAPAEQPAETPAAPAEQKPQDPAEQLLKGILGGQQQEGDESQPADPVDQLRGLFGN